MRKETDVYGTVRYYNDLGQLHRTDGAAIERANGSKVWYLNGKRHREGGPAIEWNNGYKEWRLNDLLHREDGPAVVYSNGDERWYLNGIFLSDQEIEELKEKIRWHQEFDQQVLELCGGDE